MKDRTGNLGIMVGIFIIALFIGGHLIEYVFTGLITLLSFVALCEMVPIVKWLAYTFNKLFDVAIFMFAVYAKIHFGVTIAMALLFAGLGYTLLYGPYLRETYKQ